MSRVIDGGTFVTGVGRTVRVLGIDSCDAGTVAGAEAKRRAEEQFGNPANQPVTLITEPGVASSPEGMLLRYVQLRGSDTGCRWFPSSTPGPPWAAAPPPPT